MLKNQDDIDYNKKPKFDKHFSNKLMYTADYEYEFLKLDSHFEKLRDLKEEYIRFNRGDYNNAEEIEEKLNNLISLYRHSTETIFVDISKTLYRYHDAIINPFTKAERIDKDGRRYFSRLSNGPMESLNRIPKDMKRACRGLTSFDHFRKRFLYSTRTDASILSTSRSSEDIKVRTGHKRGKYRKRNERKGQDEI